MEDALECAHWRCPDPRGKLPFSPWEEALVTDIENIGKTIWNTRFGPWVNRGPLFSVLCPKRKDDSPAPPLRHALRAKIFKAIPKHEPAVLRWMFDKFSDPKWKKNRWWYAPYAFNEQGDPFTAFSYLAGEFDPEINKLAIKDYMASKRAETHQVMLVKKLCVPSVGQQKEGVLSRIKRSQPMMSSDDERSCSSIYDVKEDFNSSEAESTFEGTTPTVYTVGKLNSVLLSLSESSQAGCRTDRRRTGRAHERKRPYR
ncbi:hypothetical protein BDV97DRAFT_106239 [Delphinella strobiligena]|nr:hypothetical protein BDV97DRAFT_106239 [Delphinella strobiligena]